MGNLATWQPFTATMSTTPSRELATFPNPNPERDYVIQFVVPEFTCNCPLTVRNAGLWKKSFV